MVRAGGSRFSEAWVPATRAGVTLGGAGRDVGALDRAERVDILEARGGAGRYRWRRLTGRAGRRNIAPLPTILMHALAKRSASTLGDPALRNTFVFFSCLENP